MLQEYGVVHEPLYQSPPECGIAYFKAAHDLLREMAGAVVGTVIPRLTSVPGTWHPTGFMVFPLGAHPRFGTLRFHVWPRGDRRREAKGRGDLGEIHDGDIHDHAWSVASLVITSYRDIFYDVADVSPETGALPADHYRVFKVAYGPNAHNALVTDGSCVVARPTGRRDVDAGDFHSIAPGQFHAPTVQSDELGATLVFSSPRVLDQGPHVLIGGCQDPIVGSRQAIRIDETARAQAQLLAAV